MKLQNNEYEFTTSEWKNKLSEGIDTRELQLMALNMFLNRIGYQLVEVANEHTLHVERFTGSKSSNPQYLSLEQAVSLYNGGGRWKVKGQAVLFFSNLVFNKVLFDKAFKKRILHRVSLHRVKSLIKVQSNWVRFV